MRTDIDTAVGGAADGSTSGATSGAPDGAASGVLPGASGDRKLGAIVPVAGLSSRMGDFKPLMDVNGFPMIRMTVQSLIDGGADVVCVVTGRNAEGVMEALGASSSALGGGDPGTPDGPDGEAPCNAPTQSWPPMRGVVFAHNPEFASSDMMASVKLGLGKLGGVAPDIDGFFLIPGDMPLAKPATIAAVGSAFYGAKPSSCSDASCHVMGNPDVSRPDAGRNDVSRPDAVIPVHEGTQAHPALISRNLFERIASFDGDGGLRAVLQDAATLEVEVHDRGSLLDADRTDDMQLVRQLARAVKGVSPQRCLELYEEAGTPQNVREHCAKVSEISRRMAEQLNLAGWHLDVELCASGAALHDIKRVEPVHSRKGARFLEERGYSALAHIVMEHDFFLGVMPTDFDEAGVVCFADKLAQNAELVTVQQRFEAALEKSRPCPHLHGLLELDRYLFERYQARYEKVTGDVLV